MSQLNRTFADFSECPRNICFIERSCSQTMANFPFICEFSVDGSEYPQRIFKPSFGKTKMAAYANKVFVCFFVTKKKYGNVYWLDIIHSVPWKIKLIITDKLRSISHYVSSTTTTITDTL